MPGPYSPDHRLGTDGPPFTDPHPSQPIPGRYRSRTRASGTAVGRLSGAAATTGAVPETPPSTAGPRHPAGAGRGRRVGRRDCARLAQRPDRPRRDLGRHRQNSDPGLPGRPRAPRHRNHRAQRAVRHLRRRARPALGSGAGQTEQRGVPQAVHRGAGDLDRQDRVLVGLPGPGAVQHARRTWPPAARPREQVQGIAQLLLQHNQVLVCSYVQRTAGSY